jgi:hypothetical protein
LDHARSDTISGKNEVAMSYFVAVGCVILLVVLVVALDGTLALMAIDRLAQSEGYTEVQSVISLH